jgi:hypothetical protein
MEHIENHIAPFPALYYVRNRYSSDTYNPNGFTIYRFRINKETEHYYFLDTGQRVHKVLKGNCFALSATEALVFSIQRAHRYLDILKRRTLDVSTFLDAVDKRMTADEQELHKFANNPYILEEMEF